MTGASGFIGRHLVDRLRSQELEVKVLTRTQTQSRTFQNIGCETRLADLLNPSSLRNVGEGIDQVVHLAANASLKEKDQAKLSVNADGTRNLLEALANSGVLRRFVYMSTMAAVAGSRGSRLSKPLVATSEATPETAYGRSKREAELIVSDRFYGTDIDWVILRPALVFGPGGRPGSGMNTITQFARRPGILGRLDFPGQLSIVHVADLVEICTRILQSKTRWGRSFFVTNNEYVTFGQVVRTASELMGQSHRQIPVDTLSRLAREVYDKLDDLMNISRWLPSYALAPIGFSLACERHEYGGLDFLPRYSLRAGLTHLFEREA